MPSAYLLVYHGSRDPRPQIGMEQLVELISQSRERLQATDRLQTVGDKSLRSMLKPNIVHSTTSQLASVSKRKPLVDKACLELGDEPLHEQIRKFGDRVASQNENSVGLQANKIEVLPLFLLPGVHVLDDIPDEVAMAQQVVERNITINLRPHLGTHPDLSRLLSNKQAAINADAWILLAHGSRLAGSKQSVEVIAEELGAVSAYWSISPSLESRVQELISKGYRQIGILPYFLFPGGITDAIAQSVEQIKQKFPSVNLHLAEPIGVSVQLADLIMDLIDK